MDINLIEIADDKKTSKPYGSRDINVKMLIPAVIHASMFKNLTTNGV